MSHPSNLMGKNPHYLNGDVTATLSNDDYFHTIYCVATASAINVKGAGIFAYLDSGVAGAGYIDPSTGVEFSGNTSAAGFYEALSTTVVEITLTAGSEIRGRFYEIDNAAVGNTTIAYK